MKPAVQMCACLGLALAISALTISCGGGRTAVIGVGNSGNRIFEADAIAEAVAEALARNESTPAVSDETLAEVFGAILAHAREGDTEAVLIVLKVAEQQRAAGDES